MRDDIKEAQAGMAALFDELGLDVEVPELRADMSEEDAAAAAAQLGHELRRAEESRAPRSRNRDTRKRYAQQRSGPAGTSNCGRTA